MYVASRDPPYVYSTMKPVIKVKNGRAYLHTKDKVGKFTCEGVYPLGSDAHKIKKFKEYYKCRVEFIT